MSGTALGTDADRPTPHWGRGALVLAVTVGLLAFVVSRVDLAGVRSALAGADPVALFATAAFSLLAYALLPSLRWQRTLLALGHRVPFGTLVFARFGSQPLKLAIPMKGGEAFRALWLSRRTPVPLGDAAATIVFDMFLVGVAQLLYLVMGLSLARSQLATALLPSVAVLGVVLALGSSFVQRLGLRLATRVSGRAGRALEQLARGFLDLPLSTKTGLLGLSLLVELTEILAMVLCLRTLGVPVPTWAVFAAMPVVMGITLLPVTISGLGTRELAILTLLGSFAPPEALLATALLFTTLEFLLPALAGTLVLPAFLAGLPSGAPARPVPVVFRVLRDQWPYWLLPLVVLVVALVAFVLGTTPEGPMPFVYGP